MIGKELIGQESEPVIFEIKTEDVNRFAKAVGIQFDDQVPATFVGTLIQSNIGGFEMPIPGMIHGEQEITYHRPIFIGDSLTYKRCIKDVYERTGKSGKLTFVVVETTGYNFSGELLFTSTSCLINPTPVRKETLS